MTKKLLLVAAIAMIDENNHILMAQRPVGKEFAGYWEFPGGKIEFGETPEDALIREIDEELGVIINPQDLKPLTFASHNYQNFHILMPLWSVYKWSGTPKAQEGQILQFYPINELVNLLVPPADIELIRFIGEFFGETYKNH
jgi:8-oxo-dGTP diphosphatase